MWVQVPKDVDTRGLCQVSEAGSLTERGASLAEQWPSASASRAGRLPHVLWCPALLRGSRGLELKSSCLQGERFGNRAVSPAWESRWLGFLLLMKQWYVARVPQLLSSHASVSG